MMLTEAILKKTLIILCLIFVVASPLAAQAPLDDDESLPEDDYIGPLIHRVPDLFSSRVYLGTPNHFGNNDPRGSWEPLVFQNDFSQIRLLPSPQTFTGAPPRSHLLPHDSQSFDIVTPTPDLPGYAPHDFYYQPSVPSYKSYESYESTDSEALVENETAQAPPPTVPSRARPSRAQPPRAPVRKRPVANKEPGHLTFSVHPPGTRILVNDDLLGLGENLGDGQAQSLKPGVYAIEAEHGQHTTERLMFSLRSGESLHVVIDLTAEGEDRGRVDKPRGFKP